MLLWLIVAALACFVMVIVARALAFRPHETQAQQAQPFAADVEQAAAHLQAAVRLKTVSDVDPSRVDSAEFARFRELLPTLFPSVFATCTYEQIGASGILLHWQGQSDAAPSVLMAHYDVVPANEADWAHPPFDGVIRDGELWGRGTLDTKGTLICMLEAAEALMKQGFQPKNDVYFSFGGNEECMGQDTPAIVDALEKRGVKPAFVLDEGGAIVQNIFPGVKESAALIGIAEKGSAFVDMTARGKSGHASSPPAAQSAGVLAKALDRLQRKPMPFALTAPARELFDLMGRHSSFAYKLIFANLWCFAPLLNLICKQGGGEMNALVRTTCAMTRLSASDAYNVLPGECKAGLNLRVICGETVATVTQRMQSIIRDPRVHITVVDGNDPSPVAPTHGEPWERVASAIHQTYPGVLVSPYLMLACSDSRHYCRICQNVYRFSGMPLTKEQRGMIHGTNERIPLSLLPNTIAFFARVLTKC